MKPQGKIHGQPGFLLVEIFVQPLAQAHVVIAVEFCRAIQDRGSLVWPGESGGEDLVRINLDKEAAPGIAGEEV